MKIKPLLITFFLLFTSGCATYFREQKEEDLVQKFKLDEQEVKKFQSVKIEKENDKVAKTATAETVQNKELRPEVLDKIIAEDNPHEQSLIDKVSTKIKEELGPSVQESQENYPEDYPEQFKEYDKKYQKMWGLYKPVLFPGEEFTMVVKYLGITAGFLKIRTLKSVMIAGKAAWHIKGRLKSADYYKYIYELDDSVESFLSKASFLPKKFQLIQRESVQEVDDLQLFDEHKFKTFFWYRRMKRGQLRKHEKSAYIPKYVQDSFSALYFARGLPLKKGILYEYPVVTRAKIWLVKFEVMGEEEIEFNDKDIMALKIKAETRFPGVLKKKGDIIFWMSNDSRRLFLKFEAKVKIGSISGKLLKYSPEKKAKKSSASTN